MKVQTLPRGLATGFVANCRAYHDAPSYQQQRDIAIRQLLAFREHYPNARLWEILELFDKAPIALGMARR